MIKQFTVCLFLSLLALKAYSQDILVTDDGDAIRAYNVEVATNKVFYTLEPDSEDSKSILKSKVLVWKKSDGTKVVLAQEENGSAGNQPESGVPHEVKREAASNNAQCLALYNADYHLVPSFKKKDKISYAGVAFLSFTDSSVISNDEIEMSLVRDRAQHPEGDRLPSPVFRYDIVISNKLNRSVYIDLANCFRTTSAGVSYCYYSSDIITENSANSSAGAFNLGGVSNALGVGGVAGDLANATTLGRSRTTSVSKTHINQRILQIPPKGKAVLSKFEYATLKKGTAVSWGEYEMTDRGEEFFFSNERITNNSCYGSLVVEPIDIVSSIVRLKKGEEKAYSSNESPFCAHYFITYSTYEDFREYSVLRPVLFVNKVIGLGDFYQYVSEEQLQKIIESFGDYTIVGCVKY